MKRLLWIVVISMVVVGVGLSVTPDYGVDLTGRGVAAQAMGVVSLPIREVPNPVVARGLGFQFLEIGNQLLIGGVNRLLDFGYDGCQQLALICSAEIEFADFFLEYGIQGVLFGGLVDESPHLIEHVLDSEVWRQAAFGFPDAQSFEHLLEPECKFIQALDVVPGVALVVERVHIHH